MKSICFVSGSSPEFLGGISLYQRNLIDYANKNNLGLDFTWIYPGKENKEYSFKGIKCIEIKCINRPILKEFSFSRKVNNFIQENNFDIINSHANWGYFLKNYKKKENQKIIHTYHGVTMPYMKIQFEKFGFLKYLFYPLLPLFYIIENPPIKKVDKIICVSENVKKQFEKLYSSKGNLETIRTGVNLDEFKKTSRDKSRKKIDLENKKIYGLYSGRGGYWNKGLDRAVELSEEIYKINKKYRLIVIGSDKKKCKKYLDFPFVEYKNIIKRKDLPTYLSAVDFFFFLSRSEGGAPALALSEAIACECLTIQSEDSKQEIFEDEKDCLIFEKFGEIEAKEILKKLRDKKFVDRMKKSAKNKIKGLSLENWGKKYFEVVFY